VGLSPPLLQININREVGTGKSHLIAVLSTTLYNIVRANSKPSPLARAAPTGVVAFSINSRTIYNLLRLLVNYSFKKLPATSLMPLQ
jgi:hypothetical protein